MLDADAIVIGSGSGGMAGAVALSQAGLKVIVLEQHEVPGGWCHSFSMGGHHFSPGVHYIGQLQPGGCGASLFEGLGVADDLQFFELDSNALEQCNVADEKFEYCRDITPLSERFIKRFPKDAKGIADYFFIAEQIHKQIPIAPDVKTLIDAITIPYRTRHLGKYGIFSLKRTLEKRVHDPLARAFMAIQAGDYGLPPKLAPFALHCGVMGHYFSGGYYPVGGGMALPLAMRKALKKNNGELRLNSKVKRIILEKVGSKQNAIAVELSDGTSLRAKHILSNADPSQTFNKMVGRENLSKKLKKRLDKTRYSLPAISLFFAVNVDVRKFGMSSGNIWYMRDTDFDGAFDRALSPNLYKQDEFDGLFITALSLKDPTQYNGRHHTLEAVTFVGYEVFKAFEGTAPNSRPNEYKVLKDKIIKMMLKTLDRAVPGLSKYIVFQELGTPTTSHHFVNSTEGSCYGTEKNLFQMGPFSFRNRTEIKNLFLCGASTTSHGVIGAGNSGVDAAATILEVDRKELIKDTKQRLRIYSAEDPTTWPDSIRSKISKRNEISSPEKASSIV